jgi:hypothetical protein
MKHQIAAALTAAFVLGAPAVASAHFILVEPAATLVQDQRGDPQKLGPCGGTTANPGQASKAVTTVTGGAMLHVKVQETVYHPGHYRIALAVNALKELPADPDTATKEGPRGPLSVSAKFKDSRAPVLVDGLFLHSVRPPAPPAGTTAPPMIWETDVRVPNINCKACTLQVVQWMAEHGYNTDGGYTYHHCATLQIKADPKQPIDKGWPAQK